LIERGEKLLYEKMVSELNQYNLKIDNDIINELRSVLEINEDVLFNSHDTYSKRQDLYDELELIYEKKQSKKSIKNAKILSEKECSEVLEYYNYRINEFN
jgi:hypothetical protein